MAEPHSTGATVNGAVVRHFPSRMGTWFAVCGVLALAGVLLLAVAAATAGDIAVYGIGLLLAAAVAFVAALLSRKEIWVHTDGIVVRRRSRHAAFAWTELEGAYAGSRRVRVCAIPVRTVFQGRIVPRHGRTIRVDDALASPRELIALVSDGMAGRLVAPENGEPLPAPVREVAAAAAAGHARGGLMGNERSDEASANNRLGGPALAPPAAAGPRNGSSPSSPGRPVRPASPPDDDVA